MHYFIVGGSRGIGLAVTRQLLDKGHEVSVGSRSRGETPAEASWYPFDALEGDFPAALEGATLSGIVYAPGSIILKPFRSLHPQQFREDFEINVVGAVRAIQGALPALKRSGNASAVLFSTVAVSQGMAFHASVAAAKGAVEGLVRSLAAELAPAIRVNAIAPSLTETPLAEKLLATPEKKEASAKRHPLGRVGQPTDIAAMATFLLDPDHNWITGQIIGVDGGMGALKG